MIPRRVDRTMDFLLVLILGFVLGGVAVMLRGCEPEAKANALPGGLRFEEGEGSGRGETRTLQGKQANASADLLAWTSTEADRYPPSLDALLEAIIAYESRNETILVGDGGDSRGPAHIQRDYWTDTGRRVEDWREGVMDREKSKQCMVDYFRRYEPEALARGDFETLARLHNSGPRWRQKLAATDGYWAKVNGQ